MKISKFKMISELEKIKIGIATDVIKFHLHYWNNPSTQQEIDSARNPLLERIENYENLTMNSDRTKEQQNEDFKWAQKVKNNLIKKYQPTLI